MNFLSKVIACLSVGYYNPDNAVDKCIDFSSDSEKYNPNEIYRLFKEFMLFFGYRIHRNINIY